MHLNLKLLKFNEFGSLNFKYIICLIFFHLLFYVMKVLKLASLVKVVDALEP